VPVLKDTIHRMVENPLTTDEWVQQSRGTAVADSVRRATGRADARRDDHAGKHPLVHPAGRRERKSEYWHTSRPLAGESGRARTSRA